MGQPPGIAGKTWTGLVAAILLWVFFDQTKHAPALLPFAPFDVDPYDVVGSFTFQVR